MAVVLNAHGQYRDERLMRRVGGQWAGSTFWCRVNGASLDRNDPHAGGIWTFEDLSEQRPAHQPQLTAREREVAALILEGMTAKVMAQKLNISHRTVEIHRANLMQKMHAKNAVELVMRLSSGNHPPQANQCGV